MKARFVIDRQKLALALDKTSKALSSAPTESILKYFLFDTTKNGVWISASDNVVTWSTFVKAHVADQGKMLFPSAKGMDLVKRAAGEVIGIGLTEDDSVSVACGSSRWNLRVRSADSYPEVGIDAYTAEVHEVGDAELLGAIRSVHKAMASNLTGFSQVMIRGGRARAADGVWFQEALIPHLDMDIAIPNVVVPDVISFLSYGQGGKVEVSLTENDLVVFQRGQDDLLSFRLPTQASPNLDKAFMAPLMTNKDDLTVSRADLKSAISRVSIASDAETQSVSLALSAATIDSVVVSARSRDGSWADEPVKCSWVGDTRKVLLHKEYILNALNAFTSDQVTFKLGPDAPASPSQVLIQAEGKSAVLNQLRHDLV